MPDAVVQVMADVMPDLQLDNTACPRCGGGFHCGVNEGSCACFGLRLSDALKAQLTAQYPGQCLCLTCLAALAAMEQAGTGTGAAAHTTEIGPGA